MFVCDSFLCHLVNLSDLYLLTYLSKTRFSTSNKFMGKFLTFLSTDELDTDGKLPRSCC